MKLLVDGDELVYRQCTVSTYEQEWPNGMVSVDVDADEVVADVERRIQTMVTKVGADDHVLAFSCASKDVWRKDLDPSYKEDRDHRRKPPAYGLVVERLRERHRVLTFPRLEADDILGIMQTRPKPTVIAGQDKDFLTLAGTVINPKTLDVQEVTPEEADLNHLLQALMGDKTDGYSGCPGIGKVRAERILVPLMGDLPAMWAAVVKTFESKGLTADDALLNARLARIVRDEDWDRKNKRVRYWTPPEVLSQTDTQDA